MSFLDRCSCHVWAIDGYTDDRQAVVVNESYDAEANRIVRVQDRRLIGHLDALVAHLVEHCRRTQVTAERCTIYGGFQSEEDGAPEHMWIEHRGYIYDTMPGAPLRRVLANPATRLQPPCEQAPFRPNKVGQHDSKLTVSQCHIIETAKWNNNECLP
jgi:hypothetical protein